MPVSLLTTKGQATIPKSIRTVLGIGPHDRIEFHIREGRVFLSASKTNATSLFGKYRDRISVPKTVAEMNTALKKRFSHGSR